MNMLHDSELYPHTSTLQVGEAVYEAAAAKGRILQNPTAYGILEAQAAGKRVYRLDVSLDYPEVPLKSLLYPG